MVAGKEPKMMSDQRSDGEGLSLEANDSQMVLVRTLASQMVHENTSVLQKTSQDHRRYLATLMGMYGLLFLVGLLATLGALLKGIVAHTGTEALPALILAGLAAVCFGTLLLLRPLEALARHTFFSSWWLVAMSGYWARTLSCTDPNRLDAHLKQISQELLDELKQLVDRYAAASSRSSLPPEVGARTEDSLTQRPARSLPAEGGGGALPLPPDGLGLPVSDGIKPAGRTPRSAR
jgi:hypothetical protein